MEPELRVRSAGEEDTAAILDLVRLSLGEGSVPREPEYWGWKHARNPFGRSPALVAESGGRLVGLRVFMRWRWEAGGRSVEAVRAVDTATHPEWRGRGIFARLTLALVDQVRAEGTAFVFNTPNPISRQGYLKMGWSSLGRLSPWIRPSRPLRLLRSALPAGARGRQVAPAPQLPESPFPRVAELLGQGGLEPLLSPPANGDRRLATARSTAYLHWRYAEIPGFDYRAAWEFEGRHGAALVFRTKPLGSLSELRVCELLVGPTPRSRALARALLREVSERSGCDCASVLGPAGAPEQRALLGAGFLPALRLGPVFTVRSLCPPGSDLVPLRASGWRLSAGDLELF